MANTHCLDLESNASQYASIADASQTGLDLSGSFTFEAWVQFESLPSSGNGVMIITKDDYSAVANRAYKFSLTNDTGTLKLELRKGYSGSSESELVDWTPTIDTWYHVAVSRDGSSGDCVFYVNSIQQGATQAGATTALQNTSAPFAIGTHFDSATPAEFFDGLIDDVRVWDDVRTPTEISDNMSVELVGNEANLVGYWKLNNDYTDETSNGNDLTASGSPIFSNDIAFSDSDNQIEHCVDGDTVALWHLSDLTDESDNALDLTNNNSATTTTGWDDTANGAYDLNGSNQYLSRADNALLKPSNVTIECWFKADSTSNSAIIDKGNLGGDYAIFIESGNIKFRVRTDSTDRTVDGGAFTDTTNWNYAALTYDGSNIKGYLNGILLGNTAATGTYNTSASQFCIGTISAASSNFFNGQIDEVTISNRAKSSNEIMKYYGGIVSAKFRSAAGTNSPVDGETTYEANATWATVHDAATGTSAGDTATASYIFTRRRANPDRRISRGYFLFDTSSMPTDAVLTLGTFNAKASTDIRDNHSNTTKSIHLITVNPASNAAITTADYDAITFTEGSDSYVTLASMSTNTYFSYNLNTTGLGWIDVDGVSKFGLVTSWDLTNTDPAETDANGSGVLVYFADQADTTSDPYLWVEYTGVTGTAYTLICSVGAFTLTGIATTLNTALKIALVTGVFALTGIATGLKRGYGIIAEKGTFALTGIATSLNTALKMTMGIGSFTLTGIATTLQRAIKLTAETGVFNLIGKTIRLYYDGWTKLVKNSTSWTNLTKNSTNWTNKNKS